jgi:two-component system response regulator (stage 0 sporulation protein A)
VEDRLFVIQKVLWDVNIPPTYLGARYLAYAGLLVLEDQDRLTMVTKWLYPEIASRYHTSWKAVERSIRTVISICWNQDGGERISHLAGHPLSRKPSPTGVIQLLARYLLRQPPEFWDGAAAEQELEKLRRVPSAT